MVARIPTEWNQEKAQAGVVNALQANPDSAVAHRDLGSAFIRVGRAPDAVTHLETALRLRPEFPEALALLEASMKHAEECWVDDKTEAG